MGKNIVILYFSGTGNTKAVAELLRDGLACGNTVELIRIEDVLLKRAAFEPRGYDLIGVGFPSYGFNAPSIVTEFVRSLPDAGGADAFVFMTCAGPCYVNDIAAFGLKRILRHRGFRIVGEKVFCMPANILIRYSDGIARQLVDAAARRARTMAGDLASGKINVRRDGALALLVRALYVWCEGPLRLLALDYRVKSGCVKCGKCAANCPRQNISMKGGRVRFGARCAGCYRCVYGCPQRAIAGRLFNFAIFKGGYDIGRIIRGDTITGDIVTKDTRGIFKTIYRYLSES